MEINPLKPRMNDPEEKRCSFCGRSPPVARLVLGPDVAICEVCVKLAQDVLGESSLSRNIEVEWDNGDAREVSANALEAMSRFTDSEREILEFRLGVTTGLPHTRIETANHFGLTIDQVRLLEGRLAVADSPTEPPAG